MILLPFESTFCLLILTKQSNTVDLRGMENGLSLIFFTRLHLLPQTSYGNNEKKQQLQTLHLYKVVSSSGAKKGCKSEGSQQYSVCDNAI